VNFDTVPYDDGWRQRKVVSDLRMARAHYLYERALVRFVRRRERVMRDDSDTKNVALYIQARNLLGNLYAIKEPLYEPKQVYSLPYVDRRE
jgi:hypothetical protein